MAEPMVKTTTAMMMDHLRPKASAMGALIKDPNQAAIAVLDRRISFPLVAAAYPTTVSTQTSP